MAKRKRKGKRRLTPSPSSQTKIIRCAIEPSANVSGRLHVEASYENVFVDDLDNQSLSATVTLSAVVQAKHLPLDDLTQSHIRSE
jgi:hypothetical protein